MGVSRMDLADATTPDRLVIEIFKHEPDLQIPIPVEDLCRRLDIFELQPLKTAGYEGGLITDRDKSDGIILYNGNSPIKRRRFTIAHELCHFLMPSHVPSEEGGFLCSQEDMFRLTGGEADRRIKMEVEANRFASRLLLPVKSFRSDVDATKDPDLQQVAKLSRDYDVSKEAVARAYVEFREEPTAILIVKDGKIVRIYRDLRKFPFLSVRQGQAVPRQAFFHTGKRDIGLASDLDGTEAGIWLDLARGSKPPTLFEQVMPLNFGYAMVLITIEPEDSEEEDTDELRTSKERYRERMARWQR
jgi:Zn-dependent peptidase ImmA (M78 family)